MYLLNYSVGHCVSFPASPLWCFPQIFSLSASVGLELCLGEDRYFSPTCIWNPRGSYCCIDSVIDKVTVEHSSLCKLPHLSSPFISQALCCRTDWREGWGFVFLVVLYLFFISFSLSKRGSNEIQYQETTSDNQGGCQYLVSITDLCRITCL